MATQPGDPDILAAAPGVEKRSAEPPRHRRRPHRRQRSRRYAAGRPALDLPRHQHAPRRAPRRPAAGRPGRWRRLPHGRDVRGLRPEREARARGLLGQRDCLLASVAGRPLADRAHRPRPGHRGRLVGVPARHRQPGAHAAVPARLHAQVADAARARLRPGVRRPRGRRRGRASGRGHAARRRRAARRRSSAPSTSSAATARAAGCAMSIGAEPRGDFANHAWGVVDMLAVTDFPDIRLKAAIQSARRGQHPAHPARGRLPGAALRRPRRDRPEQPRRLPRATRRRRSSRSRSACCARTRST